MSTLASDKATGNVTLRASNARGLELANATIDVKGVSIGIAEIERFNLVYQNLDPWILRGKTAIRLPAVTTTIRVDEFGLKGGDFDFARGNVLFDPPGRPLTSARLSEADRLRHEQCDGCTTPAKIAGGVTLTLISEQISRIEGDAFYKFPLASCKQPAVFRIDGKGYLRDLQVADMYAQYETPRRVTFGGGAEINTSLISAGFRVDGAIDVPTKTFFVEGTVERRRDRRRGRQGRPEHAGQRGQAPQRKEIIGASVIVSSIGLRACTQVAGGRFNLGYGFHQRWGEDSAPVPDWPFFEGCEGEAADFKPAGFTSGAAVSSQARRGFRVGRGVPFVNLRIDGPGGPQVVVRGPGGRRVTTRAGAPALTAGHAFAARPQENRTYVRIFRPKPGRWTVTPQPGATITRVLRADGLGKPSVHARVSRASPRAAPALLAAAAVARPAGSVLRARHWRRHARAPRGQQAPRHAALQARARARAPAPDRRRGRVTWPAARKPHDRALPSAARQRPLAPEQADAQAQRGPHARDPLDPLARGAALRRQPAAARRPPAHPRDAQAPAGRRRRTGDRRRDGARRRPARRQRGRTGTGGDAQAEAEAGADGKAHTAARRARDHGRLRRSGLQRACERHGQGQRCGDAVQAATRKREGLRRTAHEAPPEADASRAPRGSPSCSSAAAAHAPRSRSDPPAAGQRDRCACG